MKVGIPKEIKNNENRVGMTPAGVFELTKRNHTVFVQSTAGEGSGFSDMVIKQFFDIPIHDNNFLVTYFILLTLITAL